MKQFYKKLILIFVFGVFSIASCSKEDKTEDSEAKTTEISRYEVVTVDVGNLNLNEAEYQGTLAGKQILLTKSSANTLVFAVSPDADLGKTELVVNSLGGLKVNYDIKDISLTDTPENTVAPLFSKINSFSAQAEFSELEESKTSVSLIAAFNSFYKDANAEQKDAVAKLYKANKASFDFILMSGMSAKTKKFAPTEFAITAEGVFRAAVKGVIIGIGVIQVADYVVAKPPLFAVIKFVGAVLSTVALVTAAHNLLKFVGAKCKAVFLYISSLKGVNNKSANESFLTFQNDVNLSTSMNTYRRSVDVSDSKSSNTLMSDFFKAYSVYTISINSINMAIDYINKYNPLYKIPNLFVQKIQQEAQPQQEGMTQEIFNALTFSVSNSNLTLVSASLGSDGKLNMKIKAKSTSATFPVEAFINYSYKDEFSSFSGKFPIKVVMPSPLIGTWKLESFDGGFLTGEFVNKYNASCPNVAYGKYTYLSETVVFKEDGTMSDTSSMKNVSFNIGFETGSCRVVSDGNDTQETTNETSTGKYIVKGNNLEVTLDDIYGGDFSSLPIIFVNNNKVKLGDTVFIRQQ